MWKRSLFVAVIAHLSLAVASPHASAQRVGIKGGASCGTWVKEEASHKNMSEGINFSRNWIVGYLSGLAVATKKDFWGTPNVNLLDNDSVFLWVDNYCRRNPLNNLDDAGYALFIERTLNSR